jgi:hypothetical protein
LWEWKNLFLDQTNTIYTLELGIYINVPSEQREKEERQMFIANSS